MTSIVRHNREESEEFKVTTKNIAAFKTDNEVTAELDSFGTNSAELNERSR